MTCVFLVQTASIVLF